MMKHTTLLAMMLAFVGTALAQGNGTWTVYNTKNSDIGGNNISAIAADSKGVWVGTYQGLSRLNGASWLDYSMFNEKLKDQSVNCLMLDNRGKVWIGTDDYGVIEFDGTHWTEYVTETRRLKMKFIKEITQDNDGVFWIGVTLGGLVSYNGYVWEKYTPEDCGLLSDFILDLAVDRANRKWITTNAGVSVFNDRRWIGYTVENSGLPDNIVPAVAIDKNNVKWFGTLNGLASFDGEEWRIWNTANSPLPSNQVNDLVFDSDGMLWIATSAGAAVFDGDSRWVAFTSKNSQLPAGNIYKISVSRQGDVWFGSDTKGLAKLSGFTMPAPEAAPVAQAEQPKEEAPAAPQQTEEEHVRINPHLAEGYITIAIASPTATVTFTNKAGKVVKTVTNYHNNQKIMINKLPKGMYTVGVATARGEKKIKFNLK